VEPLLCVRDAAKILNVSQSLIYQYVAEQTLACVRFGARILFRTEQLENFIVRCSKAAAK